MGRYPLSGVKKVATLFLSLLFVLVNIFTIFSRSLSAAGVNVSVSSPAGGEFAALTATNVTFGYVATNNYINGNSITVSVSPTLPSALTDCTVATVDADGDSTNDGFFNTSLFTTSGGRYDFTSSTTLAITSGVNLCIRFPATTTAGIYSISVSDSTGTDFGATLVYVGDDNDVNVNAVVDPVLAFAIRDSADLTDTNSCNLGVLNLNTVSTCSYRLKVYTNAANGYVVSITSDGDLRKDGAPGAAPDADDIDPIAENSTVTAGVEGYGIALVGGSATGGVVTEVGDFDDDDTPVPNSITNLLSTNGLNSPATSDTTNTALVTHRAAIDTGTESGTYTQTVTYTVVANF